MTKASDDRILVLTGKLARPRLEKVMAGLDDPGFSWDIHDIGVKVAALMTEDIITRRLETTGDATRVLLPGRVRADLDRLSGHYGVPFERGPEELKDLPVYFGHGGGPPDLSRYDIEIFAEIVDASQMRVADVVARAKGYADAGAGVIDLGCLPDTPFPHLEDTISALKSEGLKVSVDSADPEELLRGGRAGCDFLLSLSEPTLHIAGEVDAVPVLIPAEHGDLASLYRAMDALDERGKAYLVDPVLDPIHFGFTESLGRYAQVRRERPGAEILMGTGNLTELTDADTTGITAIILGCCSELAIRNVLVVQVSPHTRRTVEEHDLARRIMFAAREDASLPQGYSDGLLCLHNKRPFPNTTDEIAENAEQVRDPNYRIEVGEDGLHIYNRDGHHVADDPFDLFPKLGVNDDGAHAFYLGAELARAETAFRLGKRYAQDEPLDWGVAADARQEDKTRHANPGATLQAKQKRHADENKDG